MHLVVAMPLGLPSLGAETAPASEECQSCPQSPPGVILLTQECLVILLAQGRESSAPRLLGVEAGGSAADSLAQPDPPRNTEDPWKTKRPECDRFILPVSILALQHYEAPSHCPPISPFLSGPLDLYSQGSLALLVPAPTTTHL